MGLESASILFCARRAGGYTVSPYRLKYLRPAGAKVVATDFRFLSFCFFLGGVF